MPCRTAARCRDARSLPPRGDPDGSATAGGRPRGRGGAGPRRRARRLFEQRQLGRHDRRHDGVGVDRGRPVDHGCAAIPTTGAQTSAAAAAGSRYYVSLGDSYAAGYQPGKGSTTDGFAYQLVDEADAQQHPLELANFACSGATTTSLLNDVGCPSVALGAGAAPYDSQTQIEAAEAFLQAHPGQVDLITVSIGGNDVTKCAAQPDPVPCVTGAVSEVSTEPDHDRPAAAGGGRPGRAHRRHDLSRRPAGLLGLRQPERPAAGHPVRHRVQEPHQPDAPEGLRVRRGPVRRRDRSHRRRTAR